MTDELYENQISDAMPAKATRKSRPARWTHKEVFPEIAAVIRERSPQPPGYVPHTEIAAGLSERKSETMMKIFDRLGQVPNPHPRKWEASNMVQWLSHRWTKAERNGTNEFEVYKLERKGEKKEDEAPWKYKLREPSPVDAPDPQRPTGIDSHDSPIT